MENSRYNQKILIPPAHLPTLLLSIGYLVYWVELYVFKLPGGITTPLAWVLFFCVCIFSFYASMRAGAHHLHSAKVFFQEQSFWVKTFIIIGLLCSLLILAIVFSAALLPPHLPQEDDALRYHLSLPRQHLILHSFWSHISWEWADLTLLSIDYGLAPYCFVDVLPNKIPHFIIFLGLVAVLCRLMFYLSGGKWKNILLVIFALIGSHNVGIQMGTAMLDLIICYLFFAALDSFFHGDRLLGSIEFVFFFWSKAFVPLQVILIALGVGLVYFLFKKFFKSCDWGWKGESAFNVSQVFPFIRQNIFTFVILTSIIAGPFLVKSLYYSGTPIYPFGTGTLMIRSVPMNSSEWREVSEVSDRLLGIKDWYGEGRTPAAFFRHFWLIAVPEKGVNNKYDYPVGLPYLLFIGPFLFLLIKDLVRKKFTLIPFFIIFFWGLWWMGLQQSRFLYIPVILIFIVVLNRIKNFSNILWICLNLALFFNAISLYRCHRGDIFQHRYSVIRPQDKEILAMNKEYFSAGRSDVVVLDHPRVSFAQFPVIYMKRN